MGSGYNNNFFKYQLAGNGKMQKRREGWYTLACTFKTNSMQYINYQSTDQDETNSTFSDTPIQNSTCFYFLFRRL